MKPHNGFRTVGRLGQPGDGNRRGVGGEDGFLILENFIELREDLELERFVLGDGLDY